MVFGKECWLQASLPIRHGGLGLRSTTAPSLPCFLSSSDVPDQWKKSHILTAQRAALVPGQKPSQSVM